MLRQRHHETFGSTLKHELINRRHFATHDESVNKTLNYIDSFESRTRLHSAHGFQSPLAYESNLTEHHIPPFACPFYRGKLTLGFKPT
ncbi:hypothetical protein EBZ70_00620 [bacterium]|nr:hypothetical protein [bacterium]